jgi:tRNA nucleotidyltransferase/poly(A) polymerase
MIVTETPSTKAREFAIQVVRRLQQAGHEALWAGGCVRDAWLGLEPTDYDVATNATPDQIRQCFGRKKTLAIGAAFGVITVLGEQGQTPVEVATFRQDAAYSDGRHPDHVTFSTAEEDALRRDFTINGLFYDPLTDKLVDYVGGKEDLKQGIVRAIRDPFERFDEDKLRLLRAVRFSATFNFEMEPATFEAVKSKAHEITLVSAERIAGEMRRMLVHPHRTAAARLLRASGLLSVLLPESEALWQAPSADPGSDGLWETTLSLLGQLERPTFRVALAGLLWGIHQSVESPEVFVADVGRRWRLSNDESKGACWLLANELAIRCALETAWPRLQRLLIDQRAHELLQLADAVVKSLDDSDAGIEFCRQKLALPPEQLNPAPLITGNDLRQAGMSPSPAFRHILETVRDAQLNGEICSRQQALELAQRTAQDSMD